MKTKWILLSAALVLLLTSASRCNINFNGITGSKNYITRDFKVGSFEKINASTVADISFIQSTDSTTSLQIYGPDNIVELVRVEIKNNTLYLKMKKKNIKNGNLKITISSPSLYEIRSSGVGNLSIKEPLATPSLKISNDGVGDIKINHITCADLEISSTGVGNATVSGKAGNAILVSHGVGNIKASELEAKNIKAESEGVGSISCHATDSIYARVNGVGSISYKGNPEKKDIKKNGIGSIRQK